LGAAGQAGRLPYIPRRDLGRGGTSRMRPGRAHFHTHVNKGVIVFADVKVAAA